MDFQFDVGFFGAASINEEFQVLTPTVDKAFLKRVISKQCRYAYLAVDSSKFHRQAMTRINDLGDYTAVVTNRKFTAEEEKELQRLGAVTIIV